MNKIIFLVIVCCLTCSPAALPADENDSANPSQAAYEEAVRLKQEGRYLDAEAQLRRAIEFQPSNANYHFELANLYAQRYDTLSEKSKDSSGPNLLDLAAKSLENVVMIRSNDIAARYNLGVVYKRLKKFEKARDEFREVLKLDPKQVNAVLQIGATYQEQGFFDDAKTYYEQAREMDYGNPGVQSAMAELEEHKRQQVQTGSRSNQDMFSRMQNMQGMFPHSNNSHAADFYRDGSDAGGANNQGMASALPYLGSWLYNQFMKSKNDQE
jgi:tetratricopeptide (TPR) repeat protein